MSEKANPLNRIVAVKTIDRLFYEPRNAKRCHQRAYQLYTRPLYGICPASNRNYLKCPDELLEMYPMPEHLESMLRLDIGLSIVMPQAEVAKVLNWFCEDVDYAVRRAKRDHAPMNAETLKKYLTEVGVSPVGEE